MIGRGLTLLLLAPGLLELLLHRVTQRGLHGQSFVDAAQLVQRARLGRIWRVTQVLAVLRRRGYLHVVGLTAHVQRLFS